MIKKYNRKEWEMSKEKPENRNYSEEALFSNMTLDELIKVKMEKELQKEILAKTEIPKKTMITEISKVPKNKIFAKNAVYEIFNRQTHQKSYINGIQAEALIGIQESVREKLENGIVDAFATDEVFVKFAHIEI